MAVSIPDKETIIPNDHIVVGFAEVKARKVRGRVQWELPGGESTYSREYATEYAKRLNKMIQTNMDRFNQSLLWS